MFIFFDNLIKGQIKKAIYNLFWQFAFGLIIYSLFAKANLGLLTKSELVGVSFFIIPPLLLSLFVLYKGNSKSENFVPTLVDKKGNSEYIVPTNLLKSGLSSFWVNVVQGGGSSIIANTMSLLISFIISPVYLLAILYLYLNDYSDLTSSLLRPFGIISVGIFAIQSRILLANYITADHASPNNPWLNWQKWKRERELFILIDLGFLIIATVFYLLGFYEALKYVLFIYGFRLIRIVLLIPYFEKIWSSIIRGIRLSSNYIFSFLIVLFVLSISSRVLFSAKNPNFKSLLSSVYTNFQIILGNGFDLARESQEILFYVFLVTILIGIIFTSAITALITDSLLEKSKAEESDSIEFKWYKREKDELKVVFYLRVLVHITKT